MNMDGDLKSRNMNNGEESNKDNPRFRNLKVSNNVNHRFNSLRDNLSNRNNKGNLRFNNHNSNNVNHRFNSLRDNPSNHNGLKENLKEGRKNIESSITKCPIFYQQIIKKKGQWKWYGNYK